jgi:hypothetical protein
MRTENDPGHNERRQEPCDHAVSDMRPSRPAGIRKRQSLDPKLASAACVTRGPIAAIRISAAVLAKAAVVRACHASSALPALVGRAIAYEGQTAAASALHSLSRLRGRAGVGVLPHWDFPRGESPHPPRSSSASASPASGRGESSPQTILVDTIRDCPAPVGRAISFVARLAGQTQINRCARSIASISPRIRASRSAHASSPATSLIKSCRISIPVFINPRASPCTGMV